MELTQKQLKKTRGYTFEKNEGQTMNQELTWETNWFG